MALERGETVLHRSGGFRGSLVKKLSCSDSKKSRKKSKCSNGCSINNNFGNRISKKNDVRSTTSKYNSIDNIFREIMGAGIVK